MPGYTELIKNVGKIRDFTRDFFVYGLRGRGDYATVSARSFDNESRRIRSYMSDYIQEQRDSSGKTFAISSDTSAISVNPLFKVWQAKSFTRNDCFLHFVLLDILGNGESLTLTEILNRMDDNYCRKLAVGPAVDAMTVRGKLREYVSLGILRTEKTGKSLMYQINQPIADHIPGLVDALSFYQNIMPGGFLAAALVRGRESPFIYRQIFFAQTLDDSIVLQLLDAIRQKRHIIIEQRAGGRNRKSRQIVPLKLLQNTRTGRRYLAMCTERKGSGHFSNARVDYICSVWLGEKCNGYDAIRTEYEKSMAHSFSIVTCHKDLHTVHMVLEVDEQKEPYVLERLRREGRHGSITRLGDNRFAYHIITADTLEMIPWLRTFIGRIQSIEGTDRTVIARFLQDIRNMHAQNAEGSGDVQ